MRTLHIVDIKGSEITGYDPARLIVVGHIVRIPLRLLVRRELVPGRLLFRRREIDVDRLLLNEDLRGRNVRVDKAHMTDFNPPLKLDRFFRPLDAVDVAQKG